MPLFRPSFRRRVLGVTPLTIFLVATLGLAGWLGYQAVDAAASHRRTAEAVLRDYAEISATEFAGVARRGLNDVLDDAFDPVVRRIRTRGPPSAAAVVRGLEDAAHDQDCPCPSLRSPLFAFRVDAPGDSDRMGVSVEAAPDSLSPAARGWIADLVSLERPGAGHIRNGILMAPAGTLAAGPTAVGYLVSDGEDGEPEPTFGFVVTTSALGELFLDWYDERRLLPRPIAGEEPNDSLLYVAVNAPGDVGLFASPNPYPMTLASSAPIGRDLGDLVVHAAVRPDAANRLIIGGLPNTRLPFFAALLILTLGAGFVQLRREQGFQRLREDFVSGVSHELRTPLAQIRMFAELQESGKLGSAKDRQRAVSVIARESRRLSHLVDNILQFSSLPRGRSPAMPRDRLDLAEAVAEGLDSVTALLRERGMKLDVAAAGRVSVAVNRDAITRIVVNLLDNAVKYGPSGQTVRVEVTRVDGAARLSVTDEGPGVPPSERDRIWKAYRRLDRDVKARVPGSGIGLSVVRELASLHGGRVWVESDDGGGARFVVELPLAEEQAADPRGGPPGNPRDGRRDAATRRMTRAADSS
jgi:signal transduction histidine kinase